MEKKKFYGLKYKGMTGYKLHRKRLKYTGGKAIRTIKYPLVSENKNKLKEFCDQIREDYNNQVGELNITPMQDKKAPYSLFNLYIDFLRAGAIFHRSKLRLKEFVDSKDNKKVQESMRKKNEEFFELIDFIEFNKKIRLNTGIRYKSSDEEIKNIFYGNQEEINSILEKENNNEEKLKGKTGIFKHKGYIKNKEKIEKYVKQILGGIGDGEGNTKEQDKQKKFWEDTFGVSFIEENKEEEAGAIYFLPDFDLEEKCGEEKLIERVRNKYGSDNLETLLALNYNNNALSYAFNKFLSFLQGKKLEEAERAILNIHKGAWLGKEKELKDKLKWLSDRVSKLPEPKLTNSWADYRTSVGGKLASWVSNTDNQKGKIRSVLFGYEKESEKNGTIKKDQIKGHKQDLKNLKNTLSKEKEYGRFKNLVNELIKLNESFYESDKNFSPEKIEIYERTLADIRTKLNEYIQQKNPDTEEKELRKEINKYKSIFATLPKLPTFPGERKKEVMKKLLNSKKILESGVEGLIKLRDKIENCNKKPIENFENEGDLDISVILLRRFDTLRNLYNNSTPYAKDIIKQAVKKVTNVDISVMTEKEVFTKYKRRGNYKEVKTYPIKKIYSCLEELINKLRSDFSKRNIKNTREYIDVIDLEKIRIGLITSFFEASVKRKDIEYMFSREYFSSLHAYLELIKEKDIDGSSLNTIIQRYVLPELKGVLNVISKKEFKERYVVQPMKSNDNFPLVFSKNKKIINLKGKKKAQQWYITRSKLKKSKEDIFVRLKEKDISKNESFEEIEEPESKFAIQTSKYQLQFLKESSPFYSEGISKDFKIEVSEYSFIVEDLCKIDFSKEEPIIENIEDKTILYVSIPFKLDTKKKVGDLKDKLEKRKRYLGNRCRRIWFSIFNNRT